MRKSIKTLHNASRGEVRLLLGDQFSRNSAILAELARGWGSDQSICVRYFGDDTMLIDKESRVFYELGVERMNVSDSWALAQAQIVSQEYTIVILLDFAQALFDGGLMANSSLRHGESVPIVPSHIVNWFLENKPRDLRILITGKEAPEELLAFVDEVMICDPCSTEDSMGHRREVEPVEPTDLSLLSPSIAGFLLSALQSDDPPVDPKFAASAD